MAITRTQTKVFFGSVNSVMIATGASNVSDLITLDPACIDGSITLKADNQGTAVSGDTVDIYAILSSGDPDGAAIDDEFASADAVHAQFLGQIDTNTIDPGLITVPYPAVPQAGKLYVVNNGASSVIFSAVVEEMRSA